jgi:predicted alpha/beta superfamily hydrolase
MPESIPTENYVAITGAPNASVVGDLRLHEFRSKLLQNLRNLRVWLPPGYDDTANAERLYPVMYLNDGQNLFDKATSFAGEWEVDETADRLIRAGEIPPMILVGIDNTQKERVREYVPHRSLNPPIMRVRGRLYPDFLIFEVMPFIRERYRVAPGAENTGLGGSSLGALISLYTAMARPGIFGRLLVESPSLFISSRRLLKETKSFSRWPQKMFVAIGTNEAGREDRDRSAVEDVRKLERNVRRRGLGEDRLRVIIEQGATHSEAHWARRFPDALRFLFGNAESALTTQSS